MHSALLLGLTFLFGCSGYESATPETDWGGGNAVAGQLIYTSSGNVNERCIDCHGANGGGIFPYSDIRDKSDAAIAAAVRLGPSVMPDYATSVITDEDLRDLIAYINSL